MKARPRILLGAIAPIVRRAVNIQNDQHRSEKGTRSLLCFLICAGAKNRVNRGPGRFFGVAELFDAPTAN